MEDDEKCLNKKHSLRTIESLRPPRALIHSLTLTDKTRLQKVGSEGISQKQDETTVESGRSSYKGGSRVRSPQGFYLLSRRRETP